VPERSRTLEVCYDTADPAAVRDVLATALGYRAVGEVDLVDPFGRGPSVWFQVTDTPSANRVHLDVHVAAEIADDVVDAGAGAGAAVDAGEAPAFTVLTDADGNRMCICTPLGRPSPA
jgi:4a-hydroxytetrahydrobiopterin dehydratase